MATKGTQQCATWTCEPPPPRFVLTMSSTTFLLSMFSGSQVYPPPPPPSSCLVYTPTHSTAQHSHQRVSLCVQTQHCGGSFTLYVSAHPVCLCLSAQLAPLRPMANGDLRLRKRLNRITTAEACPLIDLSLIDSERGQPYVLSFHFVSGNQKE